ncbi:hypothetical protein JCM8547_001463 [Rhodosporidiobolus lusitaniae]
MRGFAHPPSRPSSLYQSRRKGSPKSSLRKDAKSEAGRSEGKGEPGEGAGAAARPEELHSPALSVVPFREDDAGEEEDLDSHFGWGDDEEHEEGKHEGNGLGISVKVTTEEEGANGLGLDLGEGVELETTTPTPRPLPPSTSSAVPSALTTPASAAPESFPFPTSSTLLPDLPPPRHSPSVSHVNRSTSRLSLLGPGTSVFTLLPPRHAPLPCAPLADGCGLRSSRHPRALPSLPSAAATELL